MTMETRVCLALFSNAEAPLKTNNSNNGTQVHTIAMFRGGRNTAHKAGAAPGARARRHVLASTQEVMKTVIMLTIAWFQCHG